MPDSGQGKENAELKMKVDDTKATGWIGQS